MPRYFFHQTDGGFIPDTEGTEFPNLDIARGEAVQFAAQTIKDRPDYVWDGKDFRVEVTDEAGLLQCTIVVLGIDAPVVQIR